MNLRTVLLKAGILKPPVVDDQIYHEASVENAMMEHDALLRRIEKISQNAMVNVRLSAGIDRIRRRSVA